MLELTRMQVRLAARKRSQDSGRALVVFHATGSEDVDQAPQLMAASAECVVRLGVMEVLI